MSKLFKGFVPTKNKKCLMKFKDVDESELMTYDEVKNLSEYAGILAEDTVLLDFDDSKSAEIAMDIVEDKQLDCMVNQTTRGRHLFFINDGSIDKCYTHTKLACGLECDIKAGVKNSYVILKYGGVERFTEWDTDDDYEEVPKYFLPVKSNMDFLSMGAGDGRNQSLFNYILTLQSNDYTVEECRDTIRVINDYVLSQPLSDDEVDTILRDEAFEKPVFFGKKGAFLFEKFATYLRNNNHVIKLNGQLHIYKDGIYIAGSRAIEAEMIRHIPNLNRQKRAEVLSYLDLLTMNDDYHLSDARYIAFKNGILDIKSGELHEFDHSYIVTNKINYNYVPNAYHEITDTTLNKLACGDESIRALLEEVVGITLFRRNELRKAFILIGDKANGKSTYLDMIKSMLGDKNTCALDLNELGDRFKTAEIFNKLAVIGDDIGDEFIPNPAIFKKLTSGDRLNAERKGESPFDFNSYAKLLFSANSIPRIKDKSGAVINRLVIIPFNATFSKNDPDYDPYIKSKLRTDESMEHLIQLGLQGLKRVLENKCFTESEKVQKELEEYEETNNPILLFFKEDIKVVNEPTSHIYKKYTEFCVSNSFTPMSNIEFSKQCKKHYGVDIVAKSIKGKKYRVFVEKE